jgi:hypothetical protein
MTKIIVLFFIKKFLYWESFNPFYFEIIDLMLVYFSIFILTLIWHIFESKIFIIFGWQVTHIRLSFQKSIMSPFFKEFIYITKCFIATCIIFLIMLMLNMALHFKLIYNPKMWQCVVVQVIPLIVLSFHLKDIFFFHVWVLREGWREKKEGHFISDRCYKKLWKIIKLHETRGPFL